MRLQPSYLLLLACCANALSAQEVVLQKVGLVEQSDTQGANRSIDAEYLEKTQAKDFKDVLRNESSINISGGGSKGTQKIFLRGIESTNLSVTLDGASQGVNMSQHRSNMSGIEADLLKRVDVKTTANAEKGKGALGGSIAMTTKDAQDLVLGDESVGAIVRAQHTSADETNKGSVTLYGVYDTYGIYANISGQNGGNYKTGADGEEVLGTEQEDRDYFIKFSMVDNNNHSLRIGVGRHTRDGLVEDDKAAPVDEAAEAIRSLSLLTRDTITAEYTYKPQNPLVNFALNVYKNTIQEETTANDPSKSTYGDVTSNKREDFGGKIKNTFSVNIAATQNSFILGMDYSKEEGSTTGKNVISSAKNIGFFTQNATNIEMFTLNYGARADKYESVFGPQTISGTEISPNVGFELQVTETLNLFANYAQATRATGIIPISWMTNMGTTTWTYNDIKPETSKQKEAGLAYKKVNLFNSGDTLKLSFTLFETLIEDMIAQQGGQQGKPVTAIYNSDDALKTKGYEMRASWENEQFYTSLNYTHADTTSGNEDLVAGVGNRRGAASGDKFVWYSDYLITESLSFGYNLTALNGISYSNGTSKAGYAVHDVTLQWQALFIDGLTLSLAINNITDKEYTDQTTARDFKEPGRDYRASLRYQF